MSRRGPGGPRKAGESRPEQGVSSPPPTPTSSSSTRFEGMDRKSLTDSVEDPGYISMSGSIATETDISKSTCSMMDSGLIEEEPPQPSHRHHQQQQGHPSSSEGKVASSSKLDSGYIDAEPPSWESRLLQAPLTPREIYAQDDDGDTLLHIACMEGWKQLLFKLIQSTPNPDLLDLRNDLGQTALHVASLCGRFDEARFLLVAGATVDARDRAGCTPLHVACKKGDLRVASDLLSPVTQKEVEFLKLRYQVAVDNGSLDVGRLLLQRTYAGDTALHLAVRSGSRALVEKLLQEHTADPNVREHYCGATPLHLACRLERPDLAECLLATGRVQVNAEDYGRRTALGRAWDAHRNCPSSKALLRLVLLLRKHGGRPLQDPGSEDSDSEEDSQEESEEEEVGEGYQNEGNSLSLGPLTRGTYLVNDVGCT
ncbi:NF-kappa-B inhibitor epsilon [Ixodes scapularis]|uniref:NF-kappa-B inhibitor epsilon n=1 Tax=Ixodes scapularis TaxID=6945 RepID=UPI001C38E7C2|nr:NF-kappa-B inhibitor epsilon [Ixodes scapularis]XP_042149385.1 NF-kappa-B inhibitor epsilon [Ixodes scapularis]